MSGFTEGSKHSNPHRLRVPPLDVMLAPGGHGIGLALGIGGGDVANLEREVEELSVRRTVTGAYSNTRASPFNIEVIPVCPIFFSRPFLLTAML